MGLNQGPAYFTRCRSSLNRRPRSYSRSYSRSPSKTPERRRSCSKSPSRSPVRCPSIRSCTKSRSASYARSRSQSPSYSRTPPPNMSLTYQYGKGKLTCSLIIRDISSEMLYRDLGACLIWTVSLTFVESHNMSGNTPRRTARLSLLRWLSTQPLNRPLELDGLAIKLSHYTG